MDPCQPWHMYQILDSMGVMSVKRAEMTGVLAHIANLS